MKKPIFVFMCIASLLSSCYVTDQISITLAESYNYDILSGNPIVIEKGEDASFRIDFKNEYLFDTESNVDCYFDSLESTVVFPNRNVTSTVSFYIKKQVKYDFDFHYDSLKGNVVSSHVVGHYAENTKITLNADPNEGYAFVGWSLNQYMADPNDSPLSTESSYIFDLNADTTIYANFGETDLHAYHFSYVGNGGLLADGKNELTYIHHTTYQHIFINTLIGTQYFSREGYTFDSWNTEADGIGKRIGSGSRIQPTGNHSEQVLYAQWKIWEDDGNFEHHTDDSNCVVLTKYLGNSKLLVIPEEIDNKTVKSISNGFLESDIVEEIIFPIQLDTIEDYAFSQCTALESILFFDSLVYVNEKSFFACDSLSRLHVNAAGLPKYIWSLTAKIADMIDRISTCTEKKKMIFASDSQVAVGIDSTAIYNAFDEEYQLFNLGSEGLTSMGCILSLVETFIDEGDIFVDCNAYSYNVDVPYSSKWAIFEANYDLLSLIDLTYKTTGLNSDWLSTFTDFNQVRKDLRGYSYETNINFGNLNEFGDVFYVDRGHSEDWKATSGFIRYFTGPGCSKESASFHNAFAQKFALKGAKTYRTFQCWNVNAVEEGYATTATFDNYMNYMDSYFDYPIISHPSSFGFTGQYFAMDDYHLCQSGAVEHTKIIINDLKNQLDKEQ